MTESMWFNWLLQSRPPTVAAERQRQASSGQSMLTIETRRYSAVVEAFVERYPSAIPELNNRPVQTATSQWCTIATLKAAIDFSLKNGTVELLGFHDGPNNMWVSDDALPLVEELAERKVLRYSVARFRAPGFFERLFGRRSDA